MNETGKDPRRGRILLVDDESFFRDLIGDLLRQQGYEVEAVSSGEEALAAFGRAPVGVVVLDLVLPDLMGTEVLARMRRRDPEVAIIMVTAYASLESAITALQAGAYDYIQKPIVREDLLAAVERATERQTLAARNRALVSELSGRVADLARLSREMEEVFRVLHDGLVIIEASGRIHEVNPRAASFLGSDPALLAGKDFSLTGFPLDPSLLEAATRGGGNPAQAIVEWARPEAPPAYFHVAVLPFTLSGTQSRGYLISLSDVTEKVTLERRREEFLSIVSHDLRTPLTSLKGFIELLLGGKYESPQALREYLGILDSEADRMISLINDLLDLSRIDEGKLELHREGCSGEEIVRYAQRSMEGLAGRRGVSLVMKGAEEGGGHRLFADRQRLIQVLVNLLANAIRFSPRGGTVETELSREGDDILLSVSDQGPGIPPGERERIFDKYRQLHDSAPERIRGSGLGLTIVRGMVELHQGTVHVEAPPGGHGSRFVVRIPGRSGE